MEQQIRDNIHSAILRQDKSLRYNSPFSFQREINEFVFADDGQQNNREDIKEQIWVKWITLFLSQVVKTGSMTL